MNGIIVIYKEKGFTSRDVVSIVRRYTEEKHLGHTGTLDPNATGVLPIALGSTTRLIEYLDQSPKKYVGKGKFGISTDTQDIWGNILKETEYTGISKEILLEKLSCFVGEIDQIPSKYSAIRVNGRHLYSYAHSGEDVEIPVKHVVVYSIDLLSFDEQLGEFEIEVSCGRGTYIRSIISDLGDMLGFGACMTDLERVSACGFTLEDAVSLDSLKNMIPEEVLNCIHPQEEAVGFMNRVDIEEYQKIDFANGKHLKVRQGNLPFDELVCVFYNNELCGIGRWDNPNRIKPVKVFVKANGNN